MTYDLFERIIYRVMFVKYTNSVLVVSSKFRKIAAVGAGSVMTGWKKRRAAVGVKYGELCHKKQASQRTAS